MIFTTVLDFFLAQAMFEAAPTGKKKILILSLTLNLGLLFFFKYTSLLALSLGFFTGAIDLEWSKNIILPVGISFYTFQTISYMIDVYRGEAQVEKSFWRFTSFITFFPHLVAGPLTRHDQLIPALDHIAKVGVRPRWQAGVYLFSFGLVKKVLVADRIAELIDPLLAHSGSLGFFGAWACMLGYTLQIYFDFSGYSDMAIGLGRLLGIELPQNFNSPYKSLDIVDFWRRWHITLSQWLRDYLYISLGGNRKGELRQKINLLLTMFLGGLWHGANWTFAVWGLYHGLLLILNHLLGGKGWVRSPFVSRTITFFLVSLGWVLFRSDNFEMAISWVGQLLDGAKDFNFFSEHLLLITLLGLGLLIVQLPLSALSLFEGFADIPKPYAFGLGILAGFAVIFLSATTKFLYFQF